jgi:hypothetical protein
MTLTEAREHIGERVVYNPKFGKPKEAGVIHAVSDVVVFVIYDGDLGTKGTYARDLTLCQC